MSYSPSDHPRNPKGTPQGGQFTNKPGVGIDDDLTEPVEGGRVTVDADGTEHYESTIAHEVRAERRTEETIIYLPERPGMDEPKTWARFDEAWQAVQQWATGETKPLPLQSAYKIARLQQEMAGAIVNQMVDRWRSMEGEFQDLNPNRTPPYRQRFSDEEEAQLQAWMQRMKTLYTTGRKVRIPSKLFQKKLVEQVNHDLRHGVWRDA